LSVRYFGIHFAVRREEAGLPIRRYGFTLVELLVVIAIIGVLVALLLPAVQAARESSRFVHCKNNLRQLGLGFQLHHDQLGFYPTAGRAWWSTPVYVNGVPATGAEQEAGWGYQILPYVEQRALWLGNPDIPAMDNFLQIVANPVPIYFCPTRRPAGVDANGRAQNDYAGNGYEATGGVMTKVKPWSKGPVITRDASNLVDGLSNTLMLGEKRLNIAHLGEGAWDDNEGFISGWDQDILRMTTIEPRLDLNVRVRNLQQATAELRFGSSHPTSFNVLLCDGSVHTLSYDVDPLIFYRIGQIADGSPVELP